jgi:hypothetical protein
MATGAQPNPMEEILTQDTLGYLVESSRSQIRQQENLMEAQKITGGMARTLDAVSESAVLVNRTTNLADLEAQKYRIKAANVLGLSPTAGADELTNTIARINGAKEKLRAAQEEVVSKTTLPAWEDPIQWLKNHFTLPVSEAKMEGAAAELEMEQKNLLAMNAAMGVAEQTAARIKESVTVSSVEAAANVTAAEASLKADQARLEGLKYNSKALELAASGPKERLEAWYNLAGARQRSEQFGLALKNFEQQSAEFDWRKRIREDETAAKQEGKQLDEVLVQKIGLGYATLGMPVPSGQELKSQIAVFKAGGSKDLMRIYEIGNRSTQLGTPMIGASPAETIRNLEELPNTVAPARLEAIGLLKQIREQVLASPKIDKKDPKAVDSEINKLTAETIGGQLASISPGAGNIFDIGDLGGFIEWKDGTKGIPDMYSHPLSQKLLVPAIRAGQSLSDPKIVLSLASKAIQDGTITSNDAVDGLSFLYKKANLINQAALNLKGFGIAVPEDGMIYKARVGMFGKTVDMTSPAELGAYLAADLAQRVYGAQKSSTYPGTTDTGGGAAIVYPRP